MVGDPCLCGVRYDNFKVFATRQFHQCVIILIGIDAAGNRGDDLDVLHRLSVLGTPHGEGINAILGVDHIFQSLGDGLAEDDTSLINAVTVWLLTYSFTWMALFASALVFGKRDHMRMGFIADKLTGTKRMILELVIELLVFAFTFVVLVYGGISITKLAFAQVTASLGIPMGAVYLVIPICGVIILIYNVLNMIDIVRAKGVMPDPTDE